MTALRTMGIDQSYTSTGYVVLDEDIELCAFGTITSDKDMDVFDRSRYIADEICKQIDLYLPDIVQLEGLAFGMTGDSTRDLAGLLFTIHSQIKYTYPNINVKLVTPTSLKKHATGSGKAAKSDMINALPGDIRDLFSQFGFKKTTGLADLADAYHIATYIQ